MKRNILNALLLMLVFLFSCTSESNKVSELRVGEIFSDNMVLQRDSKVAIWGEAPSGEEVVVSFNGQTVKTKAKGGKWKVYLSPMKANSKSNTLTITAGDKVIECKNVLIGEVWIAGGQSNMWWAMNREKHWEDEKKELPKSNIRIFNSVIRTYKGDKTNEKASWQEATEESLGAFASTAYFFAEKIAEETSLPVGIITTAVANTPAEAWISRKVLLALKETKDATLEYEENAKQYSLEEHIVGQEAITKWREERQVAKKKGLKEPEKPEGAPKSLYHYQRPYGLYDNMLMPICPYTVRGFIWYQGEANISRSDEYYKTFPALIKNWRDAWGNKDMPFYFAQLSFFGPLHWYNRLREAQLFTWQSLDNTGMAVTIDVGNIKDIHPKDKLTVGYRLARFALKDVYGEEIAVSGPVYKEMRVVGSAIIIDFAYAESGLEIRGDKADSFQICGADKEFVWADAVIEGNSVVVSAESVENPIAVRYGWEGTNVPNLFNKEGLPATPFRTDSFDYTPPEN